MQGTCETRGSSLPVCAAPHAAMPSLVTALVRSGLGAGHGPQQLSGNADGMCWAGLGLCWSVPSEPPRAIAPCLGGMAGAQRAAGAARAGLGLRSEERVVLAR